MHSLSHDELGVFLRSIPLLESPPHTHTDARQVATTPALSEPLHSLNPSTTTSGSGKESASATVLLYLADTYLFEAESAVVSCADSSGSDKGTHAVVLSRTVFHPQGGGQPSDAGALLRTVDEASVFEVRHVQTRGDVVEHIGRFFEGFGPDDLHGPVLMRVDSSLRMRNARLHSAGHMIDAALARCGLLSCLKATKGYHFSDGPYVEYESSIDAAALSGKMDEINSAITAIVAESIPTSASTTGTVRVVTLAGLPCPCGGTHVASTAELAGVRVSKAKAKRGVLRLSYTIL